MKSLEVLYEEMSEHTKGECAKCRIPHSCCSPEYCEIAARWAKEEYGIELTPTGHPKLPFMGFAKGRNTGCIVPPHLRPLCTLHVCSINSIGSSGNKEWDDKYFDLSSQIAEAELNQYTRKQVTKETANEHGIINREGA